MFTDSTPLSTIKQSLIEKGGFCAEIEEYFSDYQTLYYAEAVPRFRASTDPLIVSWMLNNIALLGEENSPNINEQIILMLIEREAPPMQLLIMWRKIKHHTNITTHTKIALTGYLRGKLPSAEKPSDWIY